MNWISHDFVFPVLSGIGRQKFLPPSFSLKQRQKNLIENPI
jgi:hypothetical protein